MRGALVGRIALVLLAFAPSVSASPVLDRIVAVVEDTPIFFSDLVAREKPFIARMEATKPDAAQRAVLETEIHRAMVERMIDEALIARDARALHVSVTENDIDRALDRLAQEKKVTRDELFAAAAREGLSKAEYRAEIGRQLLEAKWLAAKAPKAMNPASADKTREVRAKLIERLRAVSAFEQRL